MNIFLIHILNILQYLLFFGFFYFSGRSFLIVLSKFYSLDFINKKIIFSKSNIIFPILGVFIVGNLLIILNFFIPLNNFIVYIVLFIFLSFNLLDRNTFLSSTIFSFENLIIYIIFPSILLFSLYSTGWHYDSGFYHLNHQNWLRESNMIIGMINIHWAFGMSSIYEYISSIMWFDGTFKFLHYINILFVHFFYIYIFNNLKYSSNLIIKNGSFLLLLYSLLDNFGVDGGRNGFLYFQGVGKQDVAVAILFLIISFSSFTAINKKKFEKENLVIIFLLALFCLQIKLSSVVLVFLMAYLLFVYAKYTDENFKNIFYVLLPSIIFSSIWILKQYLTTGCFIYPVNATCFNSFSWYIDKSTIEYEGITRSSSYSLPYFDFNFFEWSKYFYSFQINRTVTLNFLISFIVLFLFVVMFRNNFLKFDRSKLYIIIYLLINLIYLIYYGPTPRYIMGSLLLLIASISFFFKDFKFKIPNFLIYLLTILSVTFIVRFNSYSSFIDGAELEVFDPRAVAVYVPQNNGYVLPDVGDQCWINLNCTMSTHNILIDENSFFKIAKRN